MSKFRNSEVSVGYIFGGIEAFESNPSYYGGLSKSQASKIFLKLL
jgi:hypothetical protein